MSVIKSVEILKAEKLQDALWQRLINWIRKRNTNQGYIIVDKEL